MNNNIECEYPQDTRRLSRPSHSRLDELEQKINGIWEFISAANSLSRTANSASAPLQESQNALDHETGHEDDVGSSNLHVAQNFVQPQIERQHTPLTDLAALAPTNRGHLTLGDVQGTHSTTPRGEVGAIRKEQADREEPLQADLSPREARIAGVEVGQDGVISVHGPSSMMHHEQSEHATASHAMYEKSTLRASKARLISYAVIQRQSEGLIYSGPPSSMDLDGVDPELASHLLDLHWNRQHYAYLLTYRPAIMDSLMNGGPWCNKLLLNGMYYTSCLYSDRECLRRTPDDTQSAGDRFYDRFRGLLVDEIVRPSLPSAAALLLTGAALVSQVS